MILPQVKRTAPETPTGEAASAHSAALCAARALLDGLGRADEREDRSPLDRPIEAVRQQIVEDVLWTAFSLRAEAMGLSAPRGSAPLAMHEDDRARAASHLAPNDLDDVEHLGRLYEGLVAMTVEVQDGRLALSEGGARRLSGSHFTPRALAREVVSETLAPLLAGRADAASITQLRICDPAMGTGAFLLEACRFLAERLTSMPPNEARSAVAGACLYGVDKSPMATTVARLSLWLLCGDERLPLGAFDRSLKTGDSLVGTAPGRDGDDERRAIQRLCESEATTAFNWDEALPEVFGDGHGGFDAVIGNPPWVSFVGRAKQPIGDERFRYLVSQNPAFFGYRTLHGAFIWRGASLLREGGRLGFIVPTSVADLAGYAPTRRAHDALAEVDTELRDFGADAFEGVFQPAMGLYSTRRSKASTEAKAQVATWSLSRGDLSPGEQALLRRLDGLAPLDPSLFGERGFQTTGNDRAHILRCDEPTGRFSVPIREGGDVRSFFARPPRHHIDPSALQGTLRKSTEFQQIALLIRQTARYPIVALSDGAAFRNSILAGFEGDGYSKYALLCYLSGAAVRWLHYMRFRDARQGMPQVKIGHLRKTPRAAHEASSLVPEMDALGRVIAKAGGASNEQRDAVDRLAARALGLSEEERLMVDAWAQRFPPP